MMLSYFRNIEIDQIEPNDMALRYLQSKSVRYLKRSLQEMNETIRRVFYYGTDFTHTHEQMCLGNDISALDDEDDDADDEIVQNKFIESPIMNDEEDDMVYMEDPYLP